MLLYTSNSWNPAAAHEESGARDATQLHNASHGTDLQAAALWRRRRDAALRRLLDAGRSALGGHALNVFVTDSPNNDISSGFVQYADDTTLRKKEDADALQDDLNRVYIWC
ncbi:Hypothetical predicted protein [Cloeon dipterum]|uniref:Reverse transcriptase domain-containing protein n=1 Tax=Cloeon dipterum TaxID=197152 RepID=A0A8S1CT63_9INSE|nr:Hypothetical predicted protein [Cloeon dipterum]